MKQDSDLSHTAYSGPRQLARDGEISVSARRAALKDWRWRIAMVRRASAQDKAADQTQRSIHEALDTLR